MFIINLTYTSDLALVDQFLDAHICFLNEYYATGVFQASGKKVPRTGGVIFATIESKKALQDIIAKDPFYKNNLARYEVIEFLPSKTSTTYDFLLD